MARAAAAAEDEALPEADRLSPYLHPRHAPSVFGHADQIATLDDALRGARCHHAWLLTGPAGVGKATLAWRAARFALAGPHEWVPGQRLTTKPGWFGSRLVDNLAHPDLLLLRRPYDPATKRHKTVITADEVRRLRSFLGHTQGAGGWRVVIVDRSDDLNIAAANALLKTLEEPPPGTIFLLVSSQPGRLLPTIRSRCRTLVLAPLPDDVLVDACAKIASQSEAPVEGADSPSLVRLAPFAGGSPGQLLSLAATGGSRIVEDVLGHLREWPSGDAAKALRSADLVSDSDTNVLDLWVALLLQSMRAAARAAVAGRDESGGAAGSPRLIEHLGDTAALASWAELWETVARDKAAVDQLNLDRRAFVLATLARLGRFANSAPGQT
ncbi:MAG: DNA polymerase III subunit delta' [Hyphomicrobiaceae bacterium]